MADLVITAANVIAGTGAVTGDATAGATITPMQPLYLDSADSNKAKLCINTSAATTNCVGISLHAALAGQPIRYIRRGNLGCGAILTQGLVYSTTDTAGGIRLISENGSGDYATSLGVATSTSNLAVQIQVGGVAI
jgi:hypothetical protein